jgi:hypothetical protein
MVACWMGHDLETLLHRFDLVLYAVQPGQRWAEDGAHLTHFRSDRVLGTDGGHFAIRGALIYQHSTPINVMLAESKVISIFCRFKQIGRNCVCRCHTSSNHTLVQLLEELSTLVDNPVRRENEQPLINEYYKEVTPLGHLIQSGNCL